MLGEGDGEEAAAPGLARRSLATAGGWPASFPQQMSSWVVLRRDGRRRNGQEGRRGLPTHVGRVWRLLSLQHRKGERGGC